MENLNVWKIWYKWRRSSKRCQKDKYKQPKSWVFTIFQIKLTETFKSPSKNKKLYKKWGKNFSNKNNLNPNKRIINLKRKIKNKQVNLLKRKLSSKIKKSSSKKIITIKMKWNCSSFWKIYKLKMKTGKNVLSLKKLFKELY